MYGTFLTEPTLQAANYALSYQRDCPLVFILYSNPNRYPEGSIFMDCQGSELKDLETLAVNRTAWRHKVAALVF